MRAIAFLAASVATAAILLACAPVAPTSPANTRPPQPPAATAAAPAASPVASQVAPSPSALPKSIKRGGTLRTARTNDMETADPHQATGADAFYAHVYDGLVRQDPNLAAGKWDLKPELAESWQQPDAKTLVLKLRKGVKFHDGSDFNAAVAKWNLDRLSTNPKSRGKDITANVQSVDVVDEYTLKLNLKGPNAAQLVWLAIGPSANRAGMVSKAAVEKMGDNDFGRKGVGTGAFETVEYTTGNRTVVKKFDGYWEKGQDGKALPYLDQVVIRFIPDWSVALLEMKTGNLDYVGNIEPKDVAGVKKDPNLDYVDFPLRDGWRYTVGIQPKSKPWGSEVRMRRALSLAINRDAMASALGFGEGFARYYTWSPYEMGYDESLPRDTFDPNQAKKLVTDAGYPNGIDLTVIIISRQVDIRNAEMYKQMWDAVGIRTTIDAMERSAWIARGDAQNFDVTTFNLAPHPDPDQYALDFAKDGGYNWLRYYSQDMEKCLEDGRSTIDDKQRTDIYKRCQKIAHEDAYFIPTWGIRSNMVFQKYTRDVVAQWQGFDAKYAWLDK